MQIRKTANSFFYTVQNPTWVDKRFGGQPIMDLITDVLTRLMTDGH